MSDIKKRFFKDDRLNHVPKKEKDKIALFDYLSERFETGKIYSESEVNLTLRPVYDDHAVLRRYMVDYGYLERSTDGSEYVVSETDKKK